MLSCSTQNFDRIDSAMYTLFEISSLDDWTSRARNAMDHTEVDKSPVADANKLWGLFFVAFILINNFLLLNLFIGV